MAKTQDDLNHEKMKPIVEATFKKLAESFHQDGDGQQTPMDKRAAANMIFRKQLDELQTLLGILENDPDGVLENSVAAMRRPAHKNVRLRISGRNGNMKCECDVIEDVFYGETFKDVRDQALAVLEKLYPVCTIKVYQAIPEKTIAEKLEDVPASDFYANLEKMIAAKRSAK